MTQKNDGGPAFAAAWGDPVHGGDYVSGMSLRDYFAGQALAGIFANPERTITAGVGVDFAYQIADAMIAARGKPND